MKRSHPTSKNYGITLVSKPEHGSPYWYVRVRVVNKQGKISCLHRTRSWSVYGGRRKALEKAREIRDILLQTPEAVAYLQGYFRDHKNPNMGARVAYGDQQEYTIPGIIGLHVIRRPARSAHTGITYHVVGRVRPVAGGPTVNSQRSIAAHGVREAIKHVAGVIYAATNSPAPSAYKIRKATKHVEELIGN